jgi:hypothetical protein
MNKPLNLRPQLGEKRVTVNRQNNGLWEVDVRVWKANTLRGDAYWATLAYRTYQKRADAERYARRFGWGGQSA